MLGRSALRRVGSVVTTRCVCGRSVGVVAGGKELLDAAPATGGRRTFASTADDAKILADRKAAMRQPRKIERFRDFTGRWHEGTTSADTHVMEDQQLSDEMRYYNSICKGAGATLWLSVVGVEFNLLGKLGLISLEAIPGPVTWLACGSVAVAVAAPTVLYATLTLRRQMERHAFRMSVPAVVALTAERPEVELTARNKDYIAGIYSWVIRDTREREIMEGDGEIQSAAPVSDVASAEFQLTLEAQRRAERPAEEQSLPCAVYKIDKAARKDAAAEPTIKPIELLQFDLLDKMRQELVRPLSGIRAELQLPAIVTVIERERVERVAAALAPEPNATADLHMFLRWFSRTQKLFTTEKALEESPIDWMSYDAWGEESPERPPERPVEHVVITQNKWIGSQEVVEVTTTIPVEEQPVPATQHRSSDDNSQENQKEDDEDEEPDVVYAEGTVGDFFQVYDIQPPFGGSYKPEEFYVNKPVFEPLARNKVANQQLFYRMMHSKIKDPSALDWSVKDPSIESSERGEFESLMTYKMKQW
jgi:hypothetical protein